MKLKTLFNTCMLNKGLILQKDGDYYVSSDKPMRIHKVYIEEKGKINKYIFQIIK